MRIKYDPTSRALFTPERRDTLFKLGQTYTPLQLAIQAARLPYCAASEKARPVEALAKAGFESLELFVDSTSGGAAFAARRNDDEAAILAFRGTEPDNLKNLLTDARATLAGGGSTARSTN
jgi:hypothetical protein